MHKIWRERNEEEEDKHNNWVDYKAQWDMSQKNW